MKFAVWQKISLYMTEVEFYHQNSASEISIHGVFEIGFSQNENLL